MKAAKGNIENSQGKSLALAKKLNPFKKLMEDKDRIANAIDNAQSLTTLKGIKFVYSI